MTEYGDLPGDYNPDAVPADDTVNCGIYILDLGHFSERLMKYEIEFYLHCDWVDRRLAKESLLPDRAHQIWLPRNDAGKAILIWTPTVQFNMAKDVEESGEYLYGRWDGTVTKIMKYVVTEQSN
ncbi:uncharacterized protein LOC118418609 [Branchiostoma floridae]|uniref:Uncharacterized protein LOC118418609 n=1 Tax=Branchiostoma floridae TaxID=7739 RepID=A0A9J7LCY1_BRAFL|nr:uncharacterized protein LOC118418609 [Branchiostoma floridae]